MVERERLGVLQKRGLFMLGVSLFLVACSTTTVNLPVRKTYFGITRVEIPASSTPGVVALHARNVGVSASESGFSVGYSSDTLVSVPMDCRLVVLVPSEEVMRKVMESLGEAKGEGICVSEFKR